MNILVEQLKISLSPISEFIEDKKVTDIFVYGPNKVFLKRQGEKPEPAGVRWHTREDLLTAALQIARFMDRSLDGNNPILDARLPDGSRVNVVISPVYQDGACITIRKFNFEKFAIADMLRLGTFDANAVDLFKGIIKGRKNILISGGTGTGKTTLLNLLCGMIPESDVIVTCEDSREISLNHPYWAPLEAKHAFFDTDREIALRDLVKNALRMNPRWLVIGEVRGLEAVDLLRAFNTGHSGMASVHANSTLDALLALDNLVMQALDMRIEAVRQLVSRAINIVIHLCQFDDESRKIVEIVEVMGVDYQQAIPIYRTMPLYRFNFRGYVENKTTGAFVYPVPKGSQAGFPGRTE